MQTIEKLIKKIEPVDADAGLHTFIETLKEYGAVPVSRGSTIAGMVFVDDVSRREYPVATKAKAMLTKVSTLSPRTGIPEAAVALLGGRNRALPVVEDGEYVGILTEQGVLGSSLSPLSSKKVGDLANEVITIQNTENAGKARSLMGDKSIGKLPVVDEDGALVGIVEWTSLISLERPKNALGKQDRRGDYLPDSKMSITTVMERRPLTVDADADSATVAKKMAEKGCSYAIIVKGKTPVGIVTCEDFLEVLASRSPKEGVYIQITGAEDLDSFEREKLHENVDETAKKLARIYAGIEYFFLRVRRHDTQGKKHKFSVHARLNTPVGMFIAQAHGYDLATVTDKAMDNLERVVKENHSKTKKQMRRRTERARKER